MQIRRAVEIAEREEAGALLPVEAQAARRIEAGERTDRRRHAQVLDAVLVLDLGEVDALVALGRDVVVEADQIGIVRAQRMAAADVRTNLLETLHRRLPDPDRPVC